MYERTYGLLEPSYPGILNFVAQLALENIATSDAAYHDVNHTIMVTLVGQEILRGRHISVGGVTPHALDKIEGFPQNYIPIPYRFPCLSRPNPTCIYNIIRTRICDRNFIFSNGVIVGLLLIQLF
jgi:hypothetical protein